MHKLHFCKGLETWAGRGEGDRNETGTFKWVNSPGQLQQSPIAHQK